MSERVLLVTPQGLEDAAKELRKLVAEQSELVGHPWGLGHPWGHLDRYRRDYWRQDARRILAAAGIQCVDEVVVVHDPLGDHVFVPVAETADGRQYKRFEDGDKLYIKRADTSTASTRSADMSKVGAGIDG